MLLVLLYTLCVGVVCVLSSGSLVVRRERMREWYVVLGEVADGQKSILMTGTVFHKRLASDM